MTARQLCAIEVLFYFPGTSNMLIFAAFKTGGTNQSTEVQ